MDAELLAKALRAAADVLDGRAIARPDPEPSVAPEDDKPEGPVLEDLQNAAAGLIKGGNRDAVLATLKKYEAKSLSQLLPENYADALADLNSAAD